MGELKSEVMTLTVEYSHFEPNVCLSICFFDYREKRAVTVVRQHHEDHYESIPIGRSKHF